MFIHVRGKWIEVFFESRDKANGTRGVALKYIESFEKYLYDDIQDKWFAPNDEETLKNINALKDISDAIPYGKAKIPKSVKGIYRSRSFTRPRGLYK